MFGLKDIGVEFLTGNPLAVGLALVLLLGLTFLLYRRTNPPHPWYIRTSLGILRLVAVVALILALAEPVITYTREYQRPRRMSLLVDQSGSMQRVESGRSRSERVDSLLASDEMQRWRSAGELSEYYFGTELTVSSAEVDPQATSLGLSLEQLDQIELGQPSDYWMVFSDGNSNHGPLVREVAATLRTPVITVGMAAGDGERDLSIVSLEYNPVVYSGRSTEVEVKLGWQSAASHTVSVQLLDSGQILTEKTLAIDQETGFADLTLNYLPGRPGQRLLQVNIPALEGESNEDNNGRTISVKILKGRLAVLLVTSQPDYETGFLRRMLNQSDQYEVDLVVLGRGAGNLGRPFPTAQAELNRYDLVVLDDPDPGFLQSQRPLLESYLNERGGGLWVQIGARFLAGRTGEAAGRLLPFYPSAPREPLYSQFHAVPAEGQLYHPTIRLADTRAGIRTAWAELPPFRMIAPCDRVAADAVILAYVGEQVESSGERIPAMGFRRLGPGKVLATAVQPFWTWHFETLAFGGDPESYSRFIDGTIRWLTVPDDFEPIRILPTTEIYHRGESVRFDGYAFDQGYRPLQNVTGMVTLSGTGENDRYEADLVDEGEGRFRAEFHNLPPGEYAFEGNFSRDGQPLRTNHGTIKVESFTLEEFDQSGNTATLEALSRVTGGSYVPFDDFARALEDLEVKPVRVSERKEITLWGKLWLLLLFLGALALEWVFRKLNQLL